MHRGEASPRLVGEERQRLLVDCERPLGKEEGSAFSKFVEVLRADLEYRHGASQKLNIRIGTEPRQHKTCKARIVGLAQVMPIEIVELGKVETRGRLAYVDHVEPLDRLLAADDFLIAVAPAKTQQVIEHGFGQYAQLVAIGIDAERAVALGQLRPVGAVNKRHVAVDRHLPAHRMNDDELAEGVVEMVVAAQDVSDVHVMVVDHDRQHVCRRTVAAKDHEVVDLDVLNRDSALDEVVDHRLAFARGLDAHDVGLAFGPRGRGSVTPFAVDAEGTALILRLLAASGEFFLRQVTAVGVAAFQHLRSNFGVTVRAGELEDRCFVASKAQPGQAVEDGVDCRLSRTGTVGVLDTKQVFPAMVPRKKPVEQRRAGAADMEVSGWRGGKARDDGPHGRRFARCTVACHPSNLPVLCEAMASPAATLSISPPAGLEAAAMQHGPWNSASDLSRGLGTLERFLSSAGFDRGPWLAVAFGAGVAAWFGLAGPAQWMALAAACLSLAAVTFAPWNAWGNLPYLRKVMLVLPLLVLAGCLAVWLRSGVVGTPAIDGPVAGTFAARVLSVEQQPALERERLVLAMREPETGRAIRVRVNVPAANGVPNLAEGDMIRFKARLMPPAAPMLPGAFDFARSAWFGGLSATGSVIGDIAVVEAGSGRSETLSDLRARLARHVGAQMSDAEAGIATAFVTGDRGGISKGDEDAMRDAGLAHLLSISGLHVSALIGAVYVLAIRLLALIPWLALRVRLPVLAAGAGALGGIGYTILTGSEVPTVRSCIGSLLVLGALALGREPLSLRMLATAAFCVLLLWPEAVTGPSFQMSFGAVLAIVALSGAAPIRRFLSPRDESPALKVLRHLALVLLTGVVIELSLMPIGLYHFHRTGAYGALANVVAIPLSTFLIMPLIGLALMLDIAGMGAPLWWLAEQAIALMLALAHWIAARPGAVTMLPAAGTGAFLLFVAGGLWLALWSGRVRLLGLVPAVAGATMVALAPTPDVFVSGDGRNVGLMSGDGEQFFLLRDSGASYARDNLLELAGMEGQPAMIDRWPGARCNRDFCAVPVRREGHEWRLLIGRGRDTVPERALAAACDRADIVISDRWLPRSCSPRWLKADRATLGRTGGVSIRLAAREIRTVAETQGNHSWWRPAIARRSRSGQPITPETGAARNEAAQELIIAATGTEREGSHSLAPPRTGQ